MSPRQYGSISSSGGDSAVEESIELLGSHAEATSAVDVSDDSSGRQLKKGKCYHYAIAALIGVVSFNYLNGRYRQYLADKDVPNVTPSDDSNAVRVPMPKPLSSLDPSFSPDPVAAHANFASTSSAAAQDIGSSKADIAPQ